MAKEVDKAIQNGCENAEIICGICQEKPCHPKLLSCYHAYCRTCLQRYIEINCEHGNVRCPVCRSRIDINSNGVPIGVTDLFVKMTSEEEGMCEVCEIRQALGFCLECAQNYCETCSQLHSKMKVSREHHIVPNGITHLQNKNRSTSFCTKHDSEKLHYFCKDCKVPICFKCNMTTHKNHGCDDITSVADSKRKYVEQEILQQVTCRVKSLEKRLKKCKHMRQHVQDEYQEATEKMREHVNILKTRIDEQMKALVNNLRETVDKYVQVIQNQECVIENELRALKAKSCYIQQCVDFVGDAELINIFPGLEDGSLMRDRSIWLDENANIKYELPNVTQNQIQQIIGVPSTRFALSSRIKIEKLSEYKVPSRITAICGISPDAVWVAYGQCIQKFIKHQGACEIVDVGEDVLDVVKDIDGEIYIACKSAVRVVNADLSVVKCFDLPFCPSGIAISEDGKICVCFRNEGRINMYSKEGKPYLELHKDSCQGMPVHPIKTAIAFQNMYVSDFKSTNEDITVISLEGVIRNKFKQGNMDPRGLAISKQGYVFVADSRNNCIHVFNQLGIHLTTLCSSLRGTSSFTVSENELWIGNDFGNMHVHRLLD